MVGTLVRHRVHVAVRKWPWHWTTRPLLALSMPHGTELLLFPIAGVPSLADECTGMPADTEVRPLDDDGRIGVVDRLSPAASSRLSTFWVYILSKRPCAAK